MTTGPMPSGPADLQIDVDFISQQLVLATSDVRRAFIDLIPRSVAEFHPAVTTQLRAPGVDVTYSTVPSELPDPVPFAQDTADRAYDGAAVRRWWLAMLSVGRVMDVIQGFGEDQENFATGFWPGNPACPHAVLYAYLSPAPAGVETMGPIHSRPGGCPVLASSSCRGTRSSPAPTGRGRTGVFHQHLRPYHRPGGMGPLRARASPDPEREAS